MCFCINYRHLNSIIIKNRYALLLIIDLRDKLNRVYQFTTIDLRSAYYLVQIKEGEKQKTAFYTLTRHYEYLVMPFSLTNTPTTFQELVNDILRERLDQTILTYLNNILIFTKLQDLAKHVKEVTQVLKKLIEKGLRIKLEKYEFYKEEVIFLRFVIKHYGILIDPVKYKAV